MRVVELKFTGKVRDFAKKLAELKLADKNVLVVVSEKNDDNLRATNNMSNVKLVRSTYLNVFDIMNADAILFDEASIADVEEWLLGKENK